ncbi:unnamed protein product [Phytophthora fragariaefolia]|uniref:Unnamed protein product n=1 Tax=Phytophthora fragariaefolia TaxID=1490495 RepID=A0A9W7CKQ1_9STRA|nr:unnamed protein product [Phytophthora fragariaefolia]
MPATVSDRGVPHTPNYDGLFQNYDVFGRASDNPRRRNCYLEEQEPEREKENAAPHYDGLFQDCDAQNRAAHRRQPRYDVAESTKDQEGEKERQSNEPQREKRWRQTTFLANPEAAAAEAAATNRLSMSRQPAMVRERENTVAEVFPVAKTVLVTEDMYGDDDEGSPHSVAERAHLLYVERRQRLRDQMDQPHSRRRETITVPKRNTTVLPKSTTLYGDTDPFDDEDFLIMSERKVGLATDTESKTKTLFPRPLAPQNSERQPAPPVNRRSGYGRGDRGAPSQESDDTFRMDLYGRF